MNSSLFGNITSLVAAQRNSSTSNITVFATWTVSYMKDIYAAIGFVAFFANFMVVSVFLAFRKTLAKQMTTASSNFHITWQSCVDGSIGLILILNMQTEDDGTPRYAMGNIAHEILCRLWNSKVILSSAMDMSALAVLMLNFERYLAVVHPLYHRTKFCTSRRLSMIMITFSVCLSVIYRLSFGILTCRILSDGRCAAFIERISPTFQMFMGVSTFLLNYVIPFTFTLFFYISMAHKLHQKIAPDQRKISEVSSVVSLSASNILEENNSRKNEKETVNFDLVKARNNILKTSLLLSISFAICWSTNQFYRILYYFAVIPLGGFLPLYYFSVSMVFANSCINPFIYCLKYKPFQQSIKRIYLYLVKNI